jgi:hypothetical protein
LSDATTPSVADLNSAAATLKMEKLQAKINKILFTEFGYRNSDQAAKSLGLKVKITLII